MRRGLLLLLPVVLVVATAPGCGAGAPSSQEIAHARTRAEDAAARLIGTLFEELMGALKNGPPEQALHVCGEKAQKITRAIESETGVSVRRTTLKPRNPLNAPDGFERRWLEKAAESGSPEEYAAVVETADGRYELRYLRPLRAAQMCLQCHGTDLAPAVRAALQSRYPSDQATGYEPGDLRGAVSVRVRFE
jgi:hypothetical protein